MYGGNRGWNAPPPGNGYQQRPQQQQHSQGYGQPQPGARLPARPGLGASPGAYGSNSPQGEHGFVGESFKLFVGSLAAGVDDDWLEKIVGVAGPVLSLKRPTPAFAFVEFADAESVLRCLEVVNGAQICPAEGQPKALLVKADDKVRARLDQFEASRTKTDATEDALNQAREDLLAILSLIKSGARPGTKVDQQQTSDQIAAARAAAGLTNLDADDLPEAQRETITSEIAMFRERIARGKVDKERQTRQAQIAVDANSRSQFAPQQPRGGDSGWARAGQVDPQSYNKPVAFVGQGTSAAGPSGPSAGVPLQPAVSDVQREKERAEKAAQEAEAAFRERERRYEQRERARIAGAERDRTRERQLADQQDRDRSFTAERLALWDDEREADRARELFYADRQRWRAQRSAVRQREIDADAKDRAAEEAQLAQLSQQADEFLSNALPGLNPAVLGADVGAPAVKVSFGAAAVKPAAKQTVPVKAPVMDLADEEEEGKKKRELIPLSYSDDEDDAGPRSSADKVRAKVPQDQDGLWSYPIKWAALTDEIVASKLSPFASSLIVESLGEVEPELLNAVTEHIGAHKAAAELAEELEPVLDEEAPLFVTKIWRVLATELELAAAGLA